MDMSAHWLALGPLAFALVLTAVERYRLQSSDRMLRDRLRALQQIATEPPVHAGGAPFRSRPPGPRVRFGRRRDGSPAGGRPVIEGTAVHLHALPLQS